MYGIIGSAVIIGIISLQLIKKYKIKSIEGTPVNVPTKDKNYKANILGGTIFGLGWALGGACPGPMYMLLGTGVFTMIIVILSAMLGTFVYGLLKNRLPH